ncbi:NADPH-dependent oxidoreductase [Actinomadura sp. KC345]|uniref:NADPH-dependent FMN reductase n=1 Tax=Actinomadura sp. KC345 TaxID=2530371 RepID=UPI0010434DD9|nr:NAD(P)H-dependent oxidoreductase [Actinomadura sp. KC345]TDC57491.1 NADPH-dependent oxidoreductase [Actinomadura sp. KC345]
MNGGRLRLAVIVGSTREGRFGPTAARWFLGRARQRRDMDVDVLDLAEDRLPAVLTADRPPEVEAVGRRLEAADAYVVVTAEYNHSFPASLKNAIDWFLTEWQAKPVGFVSYGGVAGGLRAVEQLRLVFAELHAVTVRDSVSFSNYPGLFDGAGDPVDPETCDGAAKIMLDQLAWWAGALREARARTPYGS